jgi:hypothetical protein
LAAGTESFEGIVESAEEMLEEICTKGSLVERGSLLAKHCGRLRDDTDRAGDFNWDIDSTGRVGSISVVLFVSLGIALPRVTALLSFGTVHTTLTLGMTLALATESDLGNIPFSA